MPNWVLNETTIKAKPEIIDKIIAETINNNDEFDFELVVPMPEEIYRGPIGREEEEKYGAENCWYMWSLNHWGTKWNACDSSYSRSGQGMLKLSYNTAWSTAEPIIWTLASKYDIDSIDCKFADEDMFGGNCGRYGWTTDEGRYDHYPNNPARFSKRMWGWN